MRRISPMMVVLLVCGSVVFAQGQPPAIGRGGPPVSDMTRGSGPTCRSLFEDLAKKNDVVMVFDAGYRDQRCPDLDLKGLDLEDALRHLGRASMSFAAIQSDGSIVVAADTPQYRREYEQLGIVSIPVHHQDLKEIDKLLRSLIEARRLATDENSGLVTIRDTTEKIAIAKRLVELADQPPAEIDLELRIVELPADAVPTCNGVPCSRIDRRELPRNAVLGWQSAVTAVGKREAIAQFESPLANGDMVGLQVTGQARHVSNRPEVEITLELEARVVRNLPERSDSLRTGIGTTATVAEDQSLVLRLSNHDPSIAVLLLVDATVRRSDPWIGKQPVELLVGTESTISFSGSDLGEIKIIP